MHSSGLISQTKHKLLLELCLVMSVPVMDFPFFGRFFFLVLLSICLFSNPSLLFLPLNMSFSAAASCFVSYNTCRLATDSPNELTLSIKKVSCFLLLLVPILFVVRKHVFLSRHQRFGRTERKMYSPRILQEHTFFFKTIIWEQPFLCSALIFSLSSCTHMLWLS